MWIAFLGQSLLLNASNQLKSSLYNILTMSLFTEALLYLQNLLGQAIQRHLVPKQRQIHLVWGPCYATTHMKQPPSWPCREYPWQAQVYFYLKPHLLLLWLLIQVGQIYSFPSCTWSCCDQERLCGTNHIRFSWIGQNLSNLLDKRMDLHFLNHTVLVDYLRT